MNISILNIVYINFLKLIFLDFLIEKEVLIWYYGLYPYMYINSIIIPWLWFFLVPSPIVIYVTPGFDNLFLLLAISIFFCIFWILVLTTVRDLLPDWFLERLPITLLEVNLGIVAIVFIIVFLTLIFPPGSGFF